MPFYCQGNRNVDGAAVAARLALLCTITSLAIAQPPTLRLEYIEPSHLGTPIGSQPIRVPSTDRIWLRVILEPLPPTVRESDGERLHVLADNPGFENKLTPNVTFIVRSVSQQGSRDVPFKIYSSGGGPQHNGLELFVQLDIIGDATVHSAKLRDYAVQNIAAERRAALPKTSQTASIIMANPDAFAKMLEMLGLAYIQPGEYEITVVYTPKEGAILTSEPANFVVFEKDPPLLNGSPKP